MISGVNKTEVQQLHDERLALLVQLDNIDTEIAERKAMRKAVAARLSDLRHMILGSERAATDHQGILAQITDGLPQAKTEASKN